MSTIAQADTLKVNIKEANTCHIVYAVEDDNNKALDIKMHHFNTTRVSQKKTLRCSKRLNYT